MAVLRKRKTDPPMADHSKERDLSDLVPKWALVRLLSVSVSVGAAMGSGLFWVWRMNSEQRFEAIEKANSDPRWDALSNLSERTGRLEATTRQTLERVDRLEETDTRAQLIRLTLQVERLNERLTRKGF